MPGVNFTSIQEALDQSDPGETVYVLSGKYNENLNLSKPGITLKGVDTGEGAPVVSAVGHSSTITIAADECTVDGFVVMNSGNPESGIAVHSNGNIVSNNVITNNKGNGLGLSQSIGNTIQGNRIASNGLDGILLTGSSDNILSSNSVTENGMNGLHLEDSDNNIIRGSIFLDNKLEGILLVNSNNNLIVDNVYDSIREENCKNNIIMNNKLLIEVEISGNDDSVKPDDPDEPDPIPPPIPPVLFIRVGPEESIKSIQEALDLISPGGIIEVLSGTYHETLLVNKADITLRGIGNPIVSGDGVSNTITILSSGLIINGLEVTGSGNPHAGIEIKVSDSNIIGCRIANNRGYGVSISSSDGSIITQNTIEGNVLGGIALQDSRNCRIYRNSVVSNKGDGIRLSSSSGNVIYLNTFNNTHNAWSNGANHWNATTNQTGHNLTGLLGNIWSDYNGFDCDGDGMGDTSYLIAGGSDRDYHPIGGVPCPKKLLCISGYKHDGCTGLPLSGWKIKVNNSTQEWNATTDDNGFWRVCRLENDTYTVCEVQQSGWTQTYPAGSHTETLAGVNITNINFTNQRMYCISGYKLDKCNGALPGWNITLTNGTYNKSVLTDGAGKYEFCGLMAGVYTLTEELQKDWMPVSAPGQVTLNCTNETNKNFTSTKLLCISGYKVDDCTKTGIPDWEIILKDSNGTEVARTRTNDIGYYQFCDLEPGQYNLTETLKTGWLAGDAPADVTLDCENVTDQNFTSTKLLCISGYKKDNCDGALPGWNITLTNGSYTKSVLTDAAGKYEFCGLRPGEYELTEELQDDWMAVDSPEAVSLDCEDATNQNFTNQKLLCINGTKTDGSGKPLPGWNITLTNGSYNKSILTDADGEFTFCGLWPDQYQVCEELKDGWINVTDECQDVMLECEDKVVDFENIPASLLCINGTKINSCTGEGLAGWTIDLKNSTGAVINTTQTDANGDYSFCGLMPGSYTVCEKLLSGWKNVTPSCIDVELGRAGSEDNDFRNTDTPLLCISGYKKDGCTDEGIAGWEIILKDSNGDVVDRTTTNETGYYQFCDLDPGKYNLSETLKSGWTAGSSPGTVTLDCENVTDQNFTNFGLVCISGYKLDKCNGALPGWNITLTNGSYTKSALTDAAGKYEFCDLAAGDYELTEELQDGWMQVSAPGPVTLVCGNATYQNFTNQKPLCISGTKADGSGRPLSDWNITLTNGSYSKSIRTDADGGFSFCGLWPDQYRVCEEFKDGWINVTDECQDVMLECEDKVVDFENIPASLLCINGTKINSCTGEGLADWTIDLKNSTGAVINTTQTDANGDYSFCGLRPGRYTVCEKLLSGWKNVTPSCIDVELGRAGSEDNDFRNTDTPLLCISGYKIDGCTDEGMAGWEIILKDSTGTEVTRTRTNDTGYYEFCDLEPGEYNLTETLKTGWLAGDAPADVTLDCENVTDQNFTNRKTGGNNWTVCKDGSCNFKIIQEAINAASPGDTILVQSGTYNENAVVKKTLNLTGVDSGSGLPVVDAGGSGSAITLSAGDCILQGFNARNPSPGNSGIKVKSNKNTIIGNIATGSSLSSSSNNAISGVPFYYEHGILLESSRDNIIYGNTATGNDEGIHLESSSDNNISGNDATDNTQYGIALTSSSNNTLSDNTATGNNWGIYLYSSSDKNIISGNTATGNKRGIHLSFSSSNIIYLNTLNNTIINAWSNSANLWNSLEKNPLYNNSTGNYWSDYDGTDFDPIDGIGDQPYLKINGGSEKDNYPMMDNTTLKSGAIQISLDGSFQATPPASQAQYLLKVTNLGDSEIRDINIIDQLSSGIAGVSVESGAEPEISLEPNGTHILSWQDPGPLGPGESREIGLLALLEDPIPETLISQASVRVVSADGRNLSDEASLELNAGANISIEKEADPAFAQASDPVTFRINVSNTGQMNLKSVRVDDTLPQGMSYVSDDSNGSLSGRLVSWDLGPMEPGNSMPIILTARVNEDASGLQTNEARVTATTENNSSVFDSDSAQVDILSLNVSKEADRKTVKRGENITYTITICNDGSLPLEDVVAWDVIDKQLILLYSSMDPGEDGKWHLGTLAPGQCAAITLVVQVPERNFRFDMTSSVSGVGYVKVADDYSTTLPQLVIKNTVYAGSSSIKKQSEDTAMVTVLGEAGTELSNREHGSGSYQSEEELRIITENKSIQANRSMTAKHQPVTLSLYGSRTLNTSSLWTEKTQARNRVTGLTMTGSVSHAKNISLDSRIKLDENESVVDLYSEFEGQGQFGTREKSQDGKKTLLDSQDDYAGSFKVYQKIDEYGSGLSSTRSASGTGFVAGDRRIGKSQRSHEAGTGDYSAEEAIETYTNFIHKDINLSAAPVDLSRASPRWPNQSLKWREGIYSRDPGRTLLGEEYGSLEEMDKETLVAGLNYMQSQANFTGKASYRQAIEGQTELEQEYLGKYSIRYKASLEGTAKFDRPHINVIKEGEIIRPEKQSRTYARYKITVENDGNEMLSPIYVNDLFPPGAVYVNSSLRPSLAESSANWSLTHLPVGGRSEITLWLEIGENLSNRLVNRVQATGSHAAGWASASNISVLECGWLPCAPTQGDQIVVTKRAFVNESDSDLVWYLLRIENHGNCTPSLTVTDSLPRGMKFMEATPDVTSYDRSSNTLFWNIISLRPNGAVSIIYQVQVTDGGKQVNQVKVEAISPEGCDINSAYDSTVLILGQKNAETWPDDWKPPKDWVDQCFETSCV